MLIAKARNARCEECVCVCDCVCVCIYFYMLLGSMDLCIGKCPCMPLAREGIQSLSLRCWPNEVWIKAHRIWCLWEVSFKDLDPQILRCGWCNQKTLKMGARMSGSDRLQVHIRKPAHLSFAGSTGCFVRVVFACFCLFRGRTCREDVSSVSFVSGMRQ